MISKFLKAKRRKIPFDLIFLALCWFSQVCAFVFSVMVMPVSTVNFDRGWIRLSLNQAPDEKNPGH